MPYITGGSLLFHYDFPSEANIDFHPPENKFPIVTSEDDSYTIEFNRFSEYQKKIKVQCDDKMAWLMSALPSTLESLEDVISLLQLCDYFNTSDFWKKDDKWPKDLNEEELRAFNIEVIRTWLFQKTSRDFYDKNPEVLPSPNEYKKQLHTNLDKLKQEVLALDAINLMKSNLDIYLVSLWDSFNSNQTDKFHIFNSSTVKKMVEKRGLFPDNILFRIYPDSFIFWQQIHRGLAHELIVIMNHSILEELKIKCAEHYPNIPFEQLYKMYWPTSKSIDDNTPPIRSISEINMFMEKIVSEVEQRNRIIEDKKKKWKGSPTSFDVAVERTQSLLGAKNVSDEQFIQLLSDQLQKIESENNVIDSLSMANTNVIQLVTKVLRDERIDNAAKLAPVIVRDIQHVIERMEDKPKSDDHAKNLQALDQFVVSIRSACNRAALIDLYDRLEHSTNKQIAEKIIGDWDVIGTDIRDSERMMSESDKLRIIAYAQGNMTKQQYEDEMSKLRVKLERGEVIAQEEVVVKMFPRLKLALTRLPKEYLKDFSLVLKRAFVHQQLTHPEKFLQNPHEAAVFSAFGMDPSKIKVNKELVQQKIKHVIQNAVLNGQSEDQFPTLKELQYQIELMALKEKIITADGDPSLAPLIHNITKVRQEILSTATNLIEEEYNKCKKELTQSQENIAQHIESALEAAKSKLLRSIRISLNKKIKDNKEYLLNLTDEKIRAMLNPLDGLPPDQMRAKMLHDAHDEIDFFNKWGNPIQYENIQGFVGGDGEVLGTGVCQANTYRLITREMTSLSRNQVISDSQWKDEVKISSQDRYNHALYKVGVYKAVEKGTVNDGLSQAVLKRLQIKKIQTLNEDLRFADETAFNSDSIYKVFTEAVQQQQKSKLKHGGMVKISIGHNVMKKDGTLDSKSSMWGHAVYFRYDPKKKTAYFYDPNHGRSINFYEWKTLQNDTEFKKMSQKEQDEAVLNYMLLCFSQMIFNDFKDINDISCHQMELDVNFLDKLVSVSNTIIGGISNFFKNEKQQQPDKTLFTNPKI
ncbi:hypothetical protein OQJ02_06335 [Legionella sp. PATHC032]|uniref:hypothetical protein n=1 Tax=Legionella sp. PATHC032 TaxID=2992039 RepID=UPI001B263553|nr:hypothetical protein [Legionella sp. PATHC032]MCW8421251.1 hypothetical protein [Legionella sp. PATHC032]HAZ7573086.1 M20 family metallo-hydrolase [Legionella pneumophila]HBA1635741.1 M20 family metallo-hydrolase [Legionella pneumophila]